MGRLRLAPVIPKQIHHSHQTLNRLKLPRNGRIQVQAPKIHLHSPPMEGQSSEDQSTTFGQLAKEKDNEKKEADLTSKPGRKKLTQTECLPAHFSTSAEPHSPIDRQSKTIDYTNQDLEEQRGKERSLSIISLQSNQPPQYRLAACPNGPPLIYYRERSSVVPTAVTSSEAHK
ncbi:hypothetical protein NDU88_000632 [Pleurodeles waltl]|uniref:Uncharacterized protein n=1 Tax=Pleurodeles waltl TaxID=8319 RepID=A0AAV7URV6_PLEWA|nr:hypothetical protein NDU88_000632 [Pleurodeles waltl]